MDIRLISHASVVLTTQDCSIWTDPWLHGKAFNESWALWPPAVMDKTLLDKINYIWISHEHPDHFHIPTLRELPDNFKSRTPVFFQKNNSKKMFGALRKLGFKAFIELPHRKLITLTDKTSIYCYQVGNMDSILGVLSGGKVVLNINDAEINSRDCKVVSKDIGAIDTILNQFSIAGYSGQENRDKFLPVLADKILDNFVGNHRDLRAKNSIPFASFVNFCREDNKYINDYANSIARVASRMNAEGLGCVTLLPGDSWNTSERHKNDAPLKRLMALGNGFKSCSEDTPIEVVGLDKIKETYQKRYEQIQASYWWIFRSLLKPVVVDVPDLNCSIVFSMKENRFDVKAPEENCDLVINSQPLWFLFSAPFGCQTLGVSACYKLKKGLKNWKLYRALFSLNNAEIYLSLKFFTRTNIIWLTRRFGEGLNQLIYQVKRM